MDEQIADCIRWCRLYDNGIGKFPLWQVVDKKRDQHFKHLDECYHSMTVSQRQVFQAMDLSEVN